MMDDEPLADDEPPDPGTEDIGKEFTNEVLESAVATEAGYAVMQQVVSGLLAHSGFDGSQFTCTIAKRDADNML